MQSETWRFHEQVRELNLNCYVRLSLFFFFALSSGAREFQMNRAHTGSLAIRDLQTLAFTYNHKRRSTLASTC